MQRRADLSSNLVESRRGRCCGCFVPFGFLLRLALLALLRRFRLLLNEKMAIAFAENFKKLQKDVRSLHQVFEVGNRVLSLFVVLKQHETHFTVLWDIENVAFQDARRIANAFIAVFVHCTQRHQ